MKGNFPLKAFNEIQTPFYYYDVELLQNTLACVNQEVKKISNSSVHYAVKANANSKLLKLIQQSGLGADCVSGGEIQAALDAGFESDKIVFAGVGKADWEINLGLDANIFSFNAESIPELEVIHELAQRKGKIASIALRINPNVVANTHAHITTGSEDNKFGISLADLDQVLDVVASLDHLKLIGIHFHIGSQICDMSDFVGLCNRINAIQESLYARQLMVEHINVGGGLGIDYSHPNRQSIPDFAAYFAVFSKHLKLHHSQHLHFELGRSIVAQCGSLITRVLYIKQGTKKQFAILDAGMTDLIRPALYQAVHKIENISSDLPLACYDVVGPICESTDTFGKAIDLNQSTRGDFFAIRSAGAYGEIMAFQYNCRKLPIGYLSTALNG